MMRQSGPFGGRATLLSLLLGVFAAGAAHAQTATVTGRVTNEQGAPVQGASVMIPALNLGTITGSTGGFSLTVPEGQATGQRVNLTARFIGFGPQTRQITLSAGQQTQDFTLKADPFRLEEMVVTGTADATEQRKLSFSVARVSEEQLREVPASSPIAALAGKVSGARIAIGRGNPGAQPSIRLRGSTSLGVGESTPLIIVDGVLTRNNIADIDANDIESIEVLKGAAAGSFYGSQAANGVIQITTKRGRGVADNSVSFQSRSEYGMTNLERFVPLNQHHNFALNPDGSIRTNTQGTTRITDPDFIADNPFPSGSQDRWRNQLKEWLTDGNFYSQNFQLGVRRGQTNLNTSYTIDHNQGLLPFIDGQYRQNLRMNVDQNIGTKADISASFTYGMNKNDYGQNDATSWFELLQAPGDIDLRFPNGDDSVQFFPDLPDIKAKNARANPLYRLNNEDNAFRRERILGSLSGRYRPFEWLRLDASYGTDRLNQRDRFYNFRGFLNEGGVATQGELQIDRNNNLGENMQVGATATKLFGSLLSTTRLAYLLDRTENESQSAEGSKLNVSDVPDLGALDPTQISINSGLTTQRTINYMVAQTFDFRDRYILDFLGRRDGSSLFGPNERWQNFYRISGAYRISEDFSIPGVQELKIRAARGTAGIRPDFTAQYETYTVDDGTITKNQLGNKDLKPAIQTENEYGINVAFLNRFDFEVVHAERKTKGAFLAVPLSSAQSGGFVTQVQNAATVGAKTVELALQTRVIDRPNFSWSFNLTGDHTTQRIIEMRRAPFRVNAGGQGQDVFYYKSGEKLGIIYGARWVRNIEQLRDNPANATNFDPSQYVVNSDGYVVRASALGTNTEAPIAYVDADGNTQHVIGDVNPDFSFGFANNLRWRSFSLYALLDGVAGGDIYNFTKQWMFQDERHGDQDQSNRPIEDRRPLGFYSAGLYNGLVANDYFIEEGSYLKLRELSVAYDFSAQTLGRVGLDRYAKGLKVALIGRNLFTWTGYSGFDPEVTSGNDFNFRIDGFRYPNFRTVTGQVEIRF